MRFFSDPDLEPQYGILRNNFAAKNQKQLDFIESRILADKIREFLADSVLPHTFDLKYLKKIHKFLFEEIYDWAGELRLCGISKGGTLFCPPERIQAEGERLFKKLAGEDFRNLSQKELAERIGYYLGEINILHPFREGNGRAQRVFFQQLVRTLGFDLDWSKITQKEMVNACIEAWQTDHLYLASLIEKALFKPEF